MKKYYNTNNLDNVSLGDAIRMAEKQEQAVYNIFRKHKELSASEAVYGFAAWLTCKEKPVVFGSSHDCACIADLVKEFCDANSLADPRDAFWPTNLIYPSGEVAIDEGTGS